jgi:putative glutamine amidotransferase
MDFHLVSLAVERRIPVLAICFGMQSLNVFMGGSLIQDIPSQIQTPLRHSDPATNGHPAHSIRVASDSMLADLAGDLDAPVNSTHHQAIDRIGRGLRAVAHAPDGIVEAMEGLDPDHWILAVQWHPEKSYAFDTFSQRLFRLFLASCVAGRRKHEGFDQTDTH